MPNKKPFIMLNVQDILEVEKFDIKSSASMRLSGGDFVSQTRQTLKKNQSLVQTKPL